MPILTSTLIGLGAFAGYEALMWAIENLGAEDLEKLVAERMKKEAKAERGADLRESQVMELDLEVASQAREQTQGFQESDQLMLDIMLGGRTPGSDEGLGLGLGVDAGGTERDQAITMMEGLEPGLAERVARASRINVSPLARAAGYRPEDHYAV